jgi:hypothetical protein
MQTYFPSGLTTTWHNDIYTNWNLQELNTFKYSLCINRDVIEV